MVREVQGVRFIVRGFRVRVLGLGFSVWGIGSPIGPSCTFSLRVPVLKPSSRNNKGTLVVGGLLGNTGSHGFISAGGELFFFFFSGSGLGSEVCVSVVFVVLFWGRQGL